VQIRTHLFHGYTQAELEVDISAHWPDTQSSPYQLRVALWQGEQQVAEQTRPAGSDIIDERGAYAERTTLSIPVSQPDLWSAEQPALYRVVVSLLSPGGELIEAEAYDTGFREVAIRDGLLHGLFYVSEREDRAAHRRADENVSLRRGRPELPVSRQLI